MAETEHLGGRAEERELLAGFLDWYREIVVHKVSGLGLDAASRVMTPSGMSPLGIVAHLAAIETGWFAEDFAGRTVDPEPDHVDFRLLPEDSVESVIAGYRAACEQARAIAAAAPSLDTLSAVADKYRGHVTLRWILVHMIEETARHAGHLDLMREQIDGRTGD
jgi:hypothetical protein